ncbi:hypothetical protein [Vibrio hangzhouensis]|uniref:hypothetical protein n=1 Tax=Vibrio hangzhouensis TaxID=462991 RepID=UPI001C97A9CC|nr:hypothetical protein [Vibrio hangzhouensis]MBY6196606.1 hypothetical protein [Vibrio hangzhouensis]
MPRRDLYAVTVIVLSGILIFSVPLVHGIGLANDTLLHLVWLKDFVVSVENGYFIPRWLPESFNGLGSSTFYFYPPLPYYLGTVVTLFFDFEITRLLSVVTMLLIIFSGLSFYSLIRDKLSNNLAILFSLVYMFSPYHFIVDVGVRCALSELSSFIWYPIIFRSIIDIPTNKFSLITLSLALSGLFISHTISFLLFLPFWVSFLVFVSINSSRRSEFLFAGVFSIVICMLTTAFYWLPMVYYLDEIHASFWYNLDELIAHSFVGNTDKYDYGMQKNIAPIIDMVWLYLLSFLVFYFFVVYGTSKSGYGYFLFFLSAIGLFLVTTLSSFLWDFFYFAKRVQFSWRIFSVVEFLIIFSFAMHYKEVGVYLRRSRVFQYLLYFLLMIVVFYYIKLFSTYMVTVPQLKEAKALQIKALESSYGAEEYVPKYSDNKFREELESLSVDPVSFDESKVALKNLNVDHNLWKLEMEVLSPSEVVIKQFYFPTWKAINARTKESITVYPSTNEGLVTFEVGHDDSYLYIYIDVTPIEKYGIIISLVGLFLLFFLTVRNRQRIQFGMKGY